MIRRPPISSRTDTLFPYTTLFRSESLHLVAIEADQVAQEIDRQLRLAARFGIHADLRQDIVGDVLPALGVNDAEIASFTHHRAENRERDVAVAFGVVETTVRIFLDDNDIVLGGRLRLSHAVSRACDARQGRFRHAAMIRMKPLSSNLATLHTTNN